MTVIKINNLKENFNQEKKPLIAIWGFFDGWHVGHQALLNQMQNLAKEHNYQTLVISFDVKPQSVLLKQDMPILLNNQGKQQFLINQKIDYYCELAFNQLVAASSAEEFINWLLANNVQAVVSAKDIHFGAKGKGNLATLENSTLKVFISEDLVDEKQQKISSSYIKKLLLNKEVSHANKLLANSVTSAYTISGTVVDGIKEGRALGFPTANLKLTDNYVIPAVGVYISLTEVDSVWYQSMTVIINRDGKSLVESYLLDFNQNIYGRVIKVKFLEYLRDNLIFTNREDLINQIKQDQVNTINYFKNHQPTKMLLS